ncbi:neural proliferation differentiation and control protein 1-like [Saccostrea echinata]|uniref:neural proliferation differentiation and control protein 1-like n=1 Tax=Saccostrea echinata TaxID=191078 RepID=UPI002A81FE7A|nr:neural proliferation differentiation and control protein 1-like [Saccostrea echinata]
MIINRVILGLIVVLSCNVCKSFPNRYDNEELIKLLKRYEKLEIGDGVRLKDLVQNGFDENVESEKVKDEDAGIDLAAEDQYQQKVETTKAVSSDGTTPTPHPMPKAPQPHVQPDPDSKEKPLIPLSKDSILFIGIVTACSLAGFVGLIMAGVCWYKLHKNVKAASEVDYPAYGVTGPAKERMGPGPGDRKLAQSAQMYHYQHQKQQMIAMEKANGEMKNEASEEESDEENEEGDYTVYECPGLAPPGEVMEVRNPMFSAETPTGTQPTNAPQDPPQQ